MRKMLIAVLMMMALFTVSAAGEEGTAFGEDTLVIKGYKIGKMGEGVSLTITNAVTEMIGESGEHDTGPLEIAGDGDRINLSPMVGALLGGSSGAGIFREQVIFSYRVVGYEPANLKLSMTFSPLKNTDTTVVENNSITATYQLGNLSYSFPDEGSDVATDQTGQTGDSIKANNESATLPSVTVADTSQSFSTSFIVADGNDNGTVPRWIQRGAVAMTIDNASYDAAAVGEYEATVTVTLKDNG